MMLFAQFAVYPHLSFPVPKVPLQMESSGAFVAPVNFSFGRFNFGCVRHVLKTYAKFAFTGADANSVAAVPSGITVGGGDGAGSREGKQRSRDYKAFHGSSILDLNNFDYQMPYLGADKGS